jgi:hypothetical protein
LSLRKTAIMNNVVRVLLLLAFASCKKASNESYPASIRGTWKMVLVETNGSNAPLTKPASVEGDVIVTFVPGSDTTGTFSGRTPTNTITGFGAWTNVYALRPNGSLFIPALSRTKVNETPWGREFVDNFTKAQRYSFDHAAKLNIHTAEKTLVFEKQ